MNDKLSNNKTCTPSNVTECLYCLDSNICTKCKTSRYLTNNTCESCPSFKYLD